MFQNQKIQTEKAVVEDHIPAKGLTIVHDQVQGKERNQKVILENISLNIIEVIETDQDQGIYLLYRKDIAGTEEMVPIVDTVVEDLVLGKNSLSVDDVPVVPVPENQFLVIIREGTSEDLILPVVLRIQNQDQEV